MGYILSVSSLCTTAPPLPPVLCLCPAPLHLVLALVWPLLRINGRLSLARLAVSLLARRRVGISRTHLADTSPRHDPGGVVSLSLSLPLGGIAL